MSLPETVLSSRLGRTTEPLEHINDRCERLEVSATPSLPPKQGSEPGFDFYNAILDLKSRSHRRTDVSAGRFPSRMT